MNHKRLIQVRPNSKALALALLLAFIVGPFAPVVAYADISSGSIAGDAQNFSSPGVYSWTVPDGISSVKIKVWGAGGAGGSGEKIDATNRSGLGGGAGGYAEKTIDVTAGQVFNITVGAGGQGYASVIDGRVGNPGGASTFEGNGIALTADGGTGGASFAGGGNPSEPIGMGGGASGGDINQTGGNGGPYTTDDFINPYASSGGSAFNGGAGGSRGRCGRDGACPGSDPNSPLAQDGGFPGGGGGGSDVATGGYGASGEVAIEVVLAAPANTDQKPVGYLDNVSCAMFNGWAYDPDDQNAQIDVHFYADGEAGDGVFVGSTRANVYRSDVNSNQGITGDHGYSFALPASLMDGKDHTIFAYGINSDTSTNLNNSLLTNSGQSISGCTAPALPPATTARGNSIAFISAPSSVTAGQPINLTVKNTGTRTWISGHDLAISKSDLSENIIMTSLATTNPNDEKTLTITAPATPGNYVYRAVEQGVEWFGSQNLTVTSAPVTPPPSNPTPTPPTKTIPSIDFRAFPSILTGPGVVNLSWSSPGAESCATSWSGNNKANVGSETSPVVSATTAFTVSCVSVDGGTNSASVTVTVAPSVPVSGGTGGNNNGSGNNGGNNSGGNNGGGGNTQTRDFTIGTASGFVTTEAGGTVTFTVVLTSAPVSDVFLPVNSSKWSEGTTSPKTGLTFSPANWNTPQTVTVTGVDDSLVDGNIAYIVSVGPSQSSDVNWNNLPAKTISLTNNDNDTASGGNNGGGGNTGGNTNTGGGTTVASSGGGGGGGGSRRHCIGFNCPVETASSIVPGDILITFDNQAPAASQAFGPEQVCPVKNFITTFLRKGVDNNPNEVRKLQYFLNTYENAGLTVNGEFDDATESAVKALQTKYSDQILAPWGVTEPTGIVYITTTKYINTVYCRENPGYKGNEDIKDIIDNSVLETTPVNPDDFEGAIGQATTTIPNIAGVAGSFTERLRNALKDIHPYGLLIIALMLVGTGFILYGTYKKDLTVSVKDTNIMRGFAILSIGTVLNVLNTLSFIVNPDWFGSKTGLSLSWLLSLDLINLLLIILISLSMLSTLYARVAKLER